MVGLTQLPKTLDLDKYKKLEAGFFLIFSNLTGKCVLNSNQRTTKNEKNLVNKHLIIY